MSTTAEDLIQSARQLPSEDRQLLLRALLDEDEAEWLTKLGEPELGHGEWFAERVQKSLEDQRPTESTEEAMSRARAAVSRAALKHSA